MSNKNILTLKNSFEENNKKLESSLKDMKIDISSENRITNLKLVLTIMKKNVI